MRARAKRMTVGEALVTFLDNQYVSFDGRETKLVEAVYTVFGHGCVVGTGEALAMAKHGLKVYQGKNEQGMAHAATSYAKHSGRLRIIPCMSSIGPGSANMVTAAATATANNLPLLLLLGDTFATRQPDPVLQQIEQPYSATVTTNDAFRAVTRYFDRVSRPEMLMTAMLNAVRVLLDPALTGAVAIALPQDVQGEAYDFPVEFLGKRVHRVVRAVPSPEEVKAAAKAVKKAKKPLLVVGGGARYSGAGEAIMRFAERHNIPVAETQAGKSAIPASFPLDLGGIGVTGNSAANDIAAQCDLLIGVGTRFTDFTTASKTLFAGAKVVTVNASSMHAAKLDAISVVADAREGVKALDKALGGYASAWTDEPAAAKAGWASEIERLTSVVPGEGYVPENTDMNPGAVDKFREATGSALTQTAALGVIRRGIAKDAVIVGASGSLPGCLQRMWETDAEGSYNVEYGYSCMGYEIAGAFGAKLACPDKEVYAMVGDGGYLMLHSEMVTAVQEGVKMVVLLFDNGGFGCINNLQMGQGIDSLCTEFRKREGDLPIRDGDFLKIDYAMSARAYGFDGYTARTAEELEKALAAARAGDKPALIDIKVLPKSMTHGYGGWWNVGITELPRTDKQRSVLEEKRAKLRDGRKY